MLSVKLFFRPPLTSLLTKMSLAKSLPARRFARIRFVRNSSQTFQWQQWQRASRRGYASAGEKAKETAGKASSAMKSDLPWLIGSIAVTVPSTYFILASGSAGRNGPGKHDGGHDGEEHEEQEEGDEEHSEEQEGEEGSGDEEAAGGKEDAEGDEDEAESGEDGEAKDGDEGQDGGDEEAEDGQHKDARVMAGKKPEAGDVKPRGGNEKQDGGDEKAKGDQQGEDESDGDQEQSSDGKGRQTSSKTGKAEGKQVQEQPKDNSLSKKTASGKPGKFDEEVELENDSNSKTIHKPDAKGGAKRRIESGNAIKLGEADDDDDDDDDGGDKAAASKTPVKGQMSGKQAGLSNTDTKHSTDPANDPEKSKKSEGTPETAKLQGTVDPGRKLG